MVIRKRLFLSIALLLFCICTHAQFIGFTKTADKYFTTEEYHTLIKAAALDAAADEDIPQSVMEENYQTYQAAIEGISMPLIIKKFKWLENGLFTKPAPGTPAFTKRKEAYARELQRGVRDALLNNNTIFKSIKSLNQSDRILSFNSDVTISKNGMLTVTETIRVYNGNGGNASDNDEIQRGIKRSFPTRYTNKLGLISTVPFRIKKVLLNQQPELYFTEKAVNGIVLYVGRKDKLLSSGIYSYEITYETEKQLIYHNNKDECYWNVTGNDWSFACEKASCTVRFPEGASVIESNCYTGRQGAREHACSGDSSHSNVIRFATNAGLQPYEGFTIAASVSKGILIEESSAAGFFSLMKNNLPIPVLSILAFLLFYFHFRAWRRVGRDPKGAVIIPQFEPPKDMSPSDVGYLVDQSYGAHLFSASVIDHAVHKLVNIDVKKEGLLFKSPVYYFDAPTQVKENIGQDKLYRWYGYSISSLYGQKAEKGTYNSTIAAIYKGMEEKLKDRLLIRRGRTNSFKGLFSLNDNFAGLGVVLLIFTGIAAIIYLALFHTPALVIISIILFIVCIIIQAVFMKIMSAYTPEGRAIADHVLGFKMYLQTAEEHRFDMMNPPEKTIQLFEKYLPYAIALKCENAWAEKFEDIIAAATAQGYQPSYYVGTGSHFSTSTFTSGIASGLAGTIASASTPPSSSSGGSGGGGSSGGGGGGGGGGGW